MQFNESFYLKAYELSKSGMSNKRIGETLGVGRRQFLTWLRKKPAFKEAIERGRKGSTHKEVSNFREYVYDQLPDNLRRVWNDINQFEVEPNGLSRIEAMLEDKGSKVRKHLFLYALVHANFNASLACKKVNVPFSTFKGWCEHDPEFQDLIEEINIHKGNFFEGALIGLVAQGDTQATVFANRTFNANRGYNPKSTVDVNINGQLNHKVGVVRVDDLNLSLETRRQILEATRQKMLPAPSPAQTIQDAEIIHHDGLGTASDEVT